MQLLLTPMWSGLPMQSGDLLYSQAVAYLLTSFSHLQSPILYDRPALLVSGYSAILHNAKAISKSKIGAAIAQNNLFSNYSLLKFSGKI
jgi:hypothetical protein